MIQVSEAELKPYVTESTRRLDVAVRLRPAVKAITVQAS